MARKPFDYVADAEEPWLPPAERRSRAEQAEMPAQAAALVDVVLALPDSRWDELPLSDATLDALREYGRIKPAARGARKRQHSRIGALLRHEDLDALEAAVNAGDKGVSEREERIEALVRWRTRLVSDGPDALSAFFDAHPDADRQRVRQLVTNATRAAGTPQEARLLRTLLDALKEAAGIV